MILRTLVVTLAGLVTVSAVADTGAVEGATDIDGFELLVADNPRKDRRDDRQEERPDRRDDRQDCRQDEGRVGNDKRDCKQEGRGEDDDAPKPEDA